MKKSEGMLQIIRLKFGLRRILCNEEFFFSIWQRDRKHLAIIDTLETFLSLRMAFILLRTDTEYDKVRNVRNSADDSRRIGKRYPKYKLVFTTR